MSKSVLGSVVLLGVVAQGCGHVMTEEAHDRIVQGMREELAALQVKSAEADRLGIECAKLRHENTLLKAHNVAYSSLTDDLKGALEGLSQDGFTRMPNGAWSIEAHLLFAPGSADVSGQGRQTLKRFIDVWQGKDVKYKIVGHTDNDPIQRTANVYTTRTNLELGMHRALKVMEVLMKEGVAEERLAIESRGSTEPMVEAGGESSKRKNRRVELYVLKF